MQRHPSAALFLVSLPAACLSLLTFLAPAPAAAQDFDGGGESQMLARINQMRAAQNLAPLARHPSLDAAARTHSADMAAQQTLTHVSQSSGTPADRVRASGAQASSVAENVALHRTTEEAHAALLSSEAHRGNMLSPSSTHAGLAALRTPQGIYVTQVFAAIGPAPAVAPPPATRSVVELPPPPVMQPPAIAAQPPSVAVPGGVQRGGRAPAHLEVQEGSGGTVVYERDAPGGNITAYWVYASQRWWYYPMPANAQAGQQLAVDRSVTGPPPGFPEHPAGPGGAMPNTGPGPQAYPAAPPYQGRSGSLLPNVPPGSTVVLDPFSGNVDVQPPPDGGGAYYGTPPPPLVGAPTRAYERAYRVWQRQYQRWLREQARAGHAL